MAETAKYRCPKCGGSSLAASSTSWICRQCGQKYPCVRGMPKLYFDDAIGTQDRKLRDQFYDGIFGAFYSFMMPFIVLPVRPLRDATLHWVLYLCVWGVLVLLILSGVRGLATGHAVIAAAALLTAAIAVGCLHRQRYLFDLLVLAIPTKLAVAVSRFEPEETFADVHRRAIASVATPSTGLLVLDVSTGSCNSLYKHGWMSLNAAYTAIDLSATMLKKGQELMAARGIAVDLVLGDALDLPFQSNVFDVVLNYGAINGMSDPGKALAEMARVAKPGALLLFLDEQMYAGASRIERAYFRKVLSSHNVIHHCPIELLPGELEEVRVSQVYEFYYICTARKRSAPAVSDPVRIPAGAFY